MIVRQSTARTFMIGPVLDASGVAVTDSVVADFKISRNGAAPAALDGAATLTHRHTGHYSLAATATDLNTVGSAEVTCDDTVNACPIKVLTVIEESAYDVIFAADATIGVKIGLILSSSVPVSQVVGSGVRKNVTVFVGETDVLTIPSDDFTAKTLVVAWEPEGLGNTTDSATTSSVTTTSTTTAFAKPDLSPGTYDYSVRDTDNDNEVIFYGKWKVEKTALTDV